jgi:succinyl-CoA synthetase alpha subunit
VISVPGEYAAREAHKALDAGLNVFLFSNNVSGKDELALKQVAAEKKLLVMGPDCGTAIIAGVGLGFANAIRRGSIGVIGVAGTGLQEFTSQVHNAGLGISHAIGTGGHDLSDEIGGLTTFAALDALEADPQTEIIAVISKPAGEKTFARLLKRFETCKKPLIGCFLGMPVESKHNPSSVQRTATIDEAVQVAIKLAGGKPDLTPVGLSQAELEHASRERASWHPEQKYVRGVFSGGTFCYQSQQIFQNAGIAVYSNAPLAHQYQLEDSDHSRQHTFVDMGSDEYTLGKPHPMINGTLRKQRILAESRDPQMAILFLDFVLGYNASMDPVGELLDAILAAKKAAQQRCGALTVVASVCGTDEDPQDFDPQFKLLQQAGVIVFRSNARSTLFCSALLT